MYHFAFFLIFTEGAVVTGREVIMITVDSELGKTAVPAGSRGNGVSGGVWGLIGIVGFVIPGCPGSLDGIVGTRCEGPVTGLSKEPDASGCGVGTTGLVWGLSGVTGVVTLFSGLSGVVGAGTVGCSGVT